MPRPANKKMQNAFARDFERLIASVLPQARPADAMAGVWPVYHLATEYGRAEIIRFDDWAACRFEGAPPKNDAEREELCKRYPMAVWAGWTDEGRKLRLYPPMCGLSSKFNLHPKQYGQVPDATAIENWLWFIEATTEPATGQTTP